MSVNGKKLQAAFYSGLQIRQALERKDSDMGLAVASLFSPSRYDGKVVVDAEIPDEDVVVVRIRSNGRRFAFRMTDIVILALEVGLKTGVECELLRLLHTVARDDKSAYVV